MKKIRGMFAFAIIREIVKTVSDILKEAFLD